MHRRFFDIAGWDRYTAVVFRPPLEMADASSFSLSRLTNTGALPNEFRPTVLRQLPCAGYDLDGLLDSRGHSRRAGRRLSAHQGAGRLGHQPCVLGLHHFDPDRRLARRFLRHAQPVAVFERRLHRCRHRRSVRAATGRPCRSLLFGSRLRDALRRDAADRTLAGTRGRRHQSLVRDALSRGENASHERAARLVAGWLDRRRTVGFRNHQADGARLGKRLRSGRDPGLENQAGHDSAARSALRCSVPRKGWPPAYRPARCSGSCCGRCSSFFGCACG